MERDRPLLGTIEYGWTPGSADGPMTLDELRDSLRRVVGVDVPFEAPHGPGSPALRRLDGTNSRQAERYRAGRVLLVGDAAHVHSPMGGPGLNLGLQDAVNLGWKLAAVVNGWAPAGLLDTYESERYPVGERVMMHSQAQLALAAPGPEVDALRKLFGELASQPEVVTHLAGSAGRLRRPLRRRRRPSAVRADGAGPRPRRRPSRHRPASRSAPGAARPVRWCGGLGGRGRVARPVGRGGGVDDRRASSGADPARRLCRLGRRHIRAR